MAYAILHALVEGLRGHPMWVELVRQDQSIRVYRTAVWETFAVVIMRPHLAVGESVKWIHHLKHVSLLVQDGNKKRVSLTSMKPP